MDILAKQVNDYLKKEYELNFQFDEEKGEFNFSIDMNHVCLEVRIICKEEDRQVLFFAYVPIKIQESLYMSVFRFINKIHMKNYEKYQHKYYKNVNNLLTKKQK